MKLRHTLCAALLLSAVSTSAFAQEKSQTTGKHIPKVEVELAAKPVDDANGAATNKAAVDRTWDLEKNMQAIAAPSPDTGDAQAQTGGRTGGRAEFQDLVIKKAAPKDGKHTFMKYELEDVIVSSIAAKQNGWIEIQNISTGESKFVKYGGNKWIEILSFTQSKSAKHEKWIAVESFSHGIDRGTPELYLHCANGKIIDAATPDLNLHCANGKDVSGTNETNPKKCVNTKDAHIFCKIEGIKGE